MATNERLGQPPRTRADAAELLLLVQDLDPTPDPPLFVGGVPTTEALRRYLAGGLSAEGMAAIDRASEAPVVTQRLARLDVATRAEEQAFLRSVTKVATPERAVVLERGAAGMGLLFAPVAGRGQASDPSQPTVSKDRKMRLIVRERLEQGPDEGTLEVLAKVQGSRWLDAEGWFEVLAGGSIHASYAIQMQNGTLRREFAFGRTAARAEDVRFRLTLHGGSQDERG
jgi:hypothetical protein